MLLRQMAETIPSTLWLALILKDECTCWIYGAARQRQMSGLNLFATS